MTTKSPIPRDLLKDRFPDWWRPFNVEPGGTLDARRTAAEALGNGLRVGDLLSAVAFAYGDTAAGAELIEVIRATARQSDETFAGDAGDREPAALMAAALAYCLAARTNRRETTLASMLIRCAGWNVSESAIKGQRLQSYAELQLTRASAVVRSPSSPFPVTAERHVEGLLDELGALPEGSPHLQTTEVEPHIDAHAASLTFLAKRLDLSISRARSDGEMLREQLDITTWLLEEVTSFDGVPWEELTRSAAGLAAAWELARLTRRRAPAISHDVLLASTLVKAGVDPQERIAPSEAVRAAALVLPLTSAGLGEPSSTVTPLVAGIVAASAKESAASVKALVGNRQRSHLEIAVQFYLETLALWTIERG